MAMDEEARRWLISKLDEIEMKTEFEPNAPAPACEHVFSPSDADPCATRCRGCGMAWTGLSREAYRRAYRVRWDPPPSKEQHETEFAQTVNALTRRRADPLSPFHDVDCPVAELLRHPEPGAMAGCTCGASGLRPGTKWLVRDPQSVEVPPLEPPSLRPWRCTFGHRWEAEGRVMGLWFAAVEELGLVEVAVCPFCIRDLFRERCGQVRPGD